MKRILVFGLSPQYGGTENYVMTIYKAIDHERLQFDFLFEHTVKCIPYEQEILSRGGRIFREYYRNSERNLSGAKSPKQFIAEHPEWDGVYINTQTINTSYRLLVAAKEMKMKYRIIHAHSSGYPRTPSFKDKIYEKYFHLTKHRTVTHYLACSEKAGKWAFRGSDFMVIRNAVNFEQFSFKPSVREKMREIYNVDAETKVVGFCGRLCYSKNTEFLLKIFEEIRRKEHNVKLLIVGDGDMRPKLESIILERHMQNEVIFSGDVSNVEDYMQMMDVFVLPSRVEGFGIVLLEAQASGLYCFTSKNAVPDATNVGGNVRFLELEKGSEYWAEKIIESGMVRKACLEKLKESEYVVEASVSKIMKVFEC